MSDLIAVYRFDKESKFWRIYSPKKIDQIGVYLGTNPMDDIPLRWNINNDQRPIRGWWVQGAVEVREGPMESEVLPAEPVQRVTLLTDAERSILRLVLAASVAEKVRQREALARPLDCILTDAERGYVKEKCVGTGTHAYCRTYDALQAAIAERTAILKKLG
jgi:hypothetical protein